jgi:hypothetical protein
MSNFSEIKLPGKNNNIEISDLLTEQTAEIHTTCGPKCKDDLNPEQLQTLTT